MIIYEMIICLQTVYINCGKHSVRAKQTLKTIYLYKQII